MDAVQDGLTGTSVVVADRTMDAASRAELGVAMKRLQGGGGLLMRMADLAGGMLGRTFRLGTRTMRAVPGSQSAIARVVEAALTRAFDVAVLRLDSQAEQVRSRRFAAPLVVLSGAVGGFLGLGGFVPDATVTTLAIMREIARIGAVGGATLNATFLAHYRDLARAHFTVRRLERLFGVDAVRQAAAEQGFPPPASPSAR